MNILYYINLFQTTEDYKTVCTFVDWVHAVMFAQVLCLLFVVMVVKQYSLQVSPVTCWQEFHFSSVPPLTSFFFLIYCWLRIRPGEVKVEAPICKVNGIMDFETFTLAAPRPFLSSCFSILPLTAEALITSRFLRCFAFQKTLMAPFKLTLIIKLILESL